MCLLNDIKSTKEKFSNNSSTKKWRKVYSKENPCEQCFYVVFSWKLRKLLAYFN